MPGIDALVLQDVQDVSDNDAMFAPPILPSFNNFWRWPAPTSKLCGPEMRGSVWKLLKFGQWCQVTTHSIVRRTLLLSQPEKQANRNSILYYSMLCYAMLCYAMLCYAMLCYAMLCYAMLCYAMLCYAMLCYAMLCYAMLCYAMLCYAMLCYAMLFMLCYIRLYHTILYNLLPIKANDVSGGISPPRASKSLELRTMPSILRGPLYIIQGYLDPNSV